MPIAVLNDQKKLDASELSIPRVDIRTRELLKKEKKKQNKTPWRLLRVGT